MSSGTLEIARRKDNAAIKGHIKTLENPGASKQEKAEAFKKLHNKYLGPNSGATPYQASLISKAMDRITAKAQAKATKTTEGKKTRITAKAQAKATKTTEGKKTAKE